MPRFPTKLPFRLGHIVHGRLTVISDGIRPPRATRHAGLGFPFRFGEDGPVAALARAASAAFHSRLTIWTKLLPLLLVAAALWSTAACGGEPETPSALGSTRETSSGVSSSSATRAAAAPTVSTTTNDPTLSAGSSATEGTASPVATPTPVPASTQRTNPSTSQPTHTAPGTPEPSDTEPDDHSMAEMLSDYGEFYFNNGRYHRALQVLDRAIEIQPSSARAYALRGAAYGKLRKFEQALEDLDQAISLDPADAVQAYLARSNVHIQLGEYDKAIQDSGAALAGVVRSINDRTSEPAEHTARRELQDRHRRQWSAATTAMAVAFFRAGNYPDYESHFGDVLYRIEGYHEAGVGFNSPFEEQHDKIQEINNNLILEPDNGFIHYQRAQIYAEIGWPEKAVEDYTKAFEIWRQSGFSSAPDKMGRGRAYLELRQYDLAIDDFRAMENLGRGTGSRLDPAIHTSVAKTLAREYFKARSVEETARVVNEYLHDANDFPDGIGDLVFLGFLRAAQGDFNGAEKYLNVFLCDATERQCAYPEGISTEQLRDAPPQGLMRSLWIFQRLWPASNYYAPLAPLADEIDNVSVNRYMSRLFLYMQDVPSGIGRYHSLLASEMLIEQAPDLPDGHIANAVAHLGLANLRIREAKDAETAQPMLDHYAQAAEAYARFQSIAGPDDMLLGKDKMEEAYRTLALNHLKNSVGSPETDYRQEHFELAGAVFEQYAELTEPDGEFRAEYAFSRGRALASWGRKEDAQAAYKEAFDLGYDRAAVERALADLSNR